MKKLLFRSTNRKSPLVSFREAILKGQPPDYGLYMPVFIPRIEKEEIEKFKNMSYSEIAFHIIRRFYRKNTYLLLFMRIKNLR